MGLLLLLTEVFSPAWAAQPYASDNNRYDGDHLKLYVTTVGFQRVGANDGKIYCAPAGTKLAVHVETEALSYVRVLSFKDVDDTSTGTGNTCKEPDRLSPAYDYQIDTTTLHRLDARRTGVSFGGLIVPFKFRLGANELVSSTTIAPYVGYRTGLADRVGLVFTPVISAGLALTPVADPAGSKTNTRSAFSAAIGFVVNSSKNDAFQAGLLLGRDYLNRSDRAGDPNSNKPWISLYLGYAISK